MAQEIKFYMQKDGDNTVKDLEKDFDGLRYQKCVGLNDKGKRKNIYTEEYSDSDTLRVWQGDEVLRQATDITFSFVFAGETRHKAYDDFVAYVNNGKIHYWDTARNKEAYLVLISEVKIGDEDWYGSTPYFKVDFKFQNLWGECKDKK